MARPDAGRPRPPGARRRWRPLSGTPAELATLRRLVDDGVSITEAARTLKIGRSTAYEALAQC
ncbi:helix-turn-helix domain-containing protein [Microbispora rosea]|uniref:helix-turn-helix domain-containing protein n=1 Tax=Microbispora rosea TaxID=58117 RepID=UPI00378D8AAB